MKIAVIGAGVAGLYSAKMLVGKGHEITIFESDKNIGGLARSHSYKNYSYDVGPHIVFSRDPKILEEMLQIHNSWNKFRRENVIIINGKKVNYPFENYLGMLDDKTNEYCLNNLIDNQHESLNPINMEEFFLKTFGKGIYETYLYPYNKKLWKRELTQLDLQMVERIPNPPKQDIIDGSERKYKEGYTHQSYFYYPKYGGIQSFVDSLYQSIDGKCNLQLNTKVNQINYENGILTIDSDRVSRDKHFDKVISTIPLVDLLQSGSNIKQLSLLNSCGSSLEYLGIIYGVIEVQSVINNDIFAVTVPDSDIVFHRITYLNNLIDNEKTIQNLQHVFLFEISIEANNHRMMGKEEIGVEVLNGMRKAGITLEKEYVGLDVNFAEKAYVVYNHNHRNDVNRIINSLKEQNIYAVGRMGSHEYYNMDQVINNCQKIISEIK
jgi:protoporphyrinogen oxidase